MTIIRLQCAALIATLMAGALLASPASAIPKFKLPITKRGFTANAATSVFRTPGEHDTITCASGTMAGTILNEVTVLVKVEFSRCFLEEDENGPCTIKTVGSVGGSISAALTFGLLGLLHQPNGAAGILFEPSASHVFLTFAPTGAPCRTSTTAVEGSVAGLIGGTGKLQNTGKVTFAVVSPTGKEAVSLILTLLGLIKPKLDAFGAAESTDEHVDSATFEEAVELD